MLEPVSGICCREEDGCGKPAGRWIQPETHSGQQGLPARDAPNFVLHTLLGSVHSVVLPTMDSLQGLLHLEEKRTSV